MKVQEATSFMSKLGEAAAKPGHYVNQIPHTNVYSVQSTKNNTVNTEKIAGLVEECFQAYKNDKDMSHQRRHALMEELKGHIENYEGRVYNSKTWYQKFGSWFGCISDGEKQLRATFKLAEEEKKISEKALKKFDEIGKLHQKRTEKPLNQIKAAFMKVGKMENSTYESFSQSGGIKSYLDDLEAYKQKNAVGPEFVKTVELLKEAHSLALLLEISVEAKGSLKTDALNELKNRMTEKLATLEKGKVGDEILFPGGYHTTNDKGKVTGGHSVLYRIVKESNDKYSLTIVNTGEGSLEAANMNNVIAMFTGSRSDVQDIKYTNIPLSKLNRSLVDKIASPVLPDKSSPMKAVVKDMDSVLQPDDSRIFKDTSKVQKGSGRIHKEQIGGSCSFKSVSSFIHEQLGDKDYRPFKAFVTERELERVTKLKGTTRVHASVLNDIEDVGNKLLVKRQAKAARK